MPNTLYYGDNLRVMREYIADDSVDLIYLDPPFGSARNYNVLFKDEKGVDSQAQIVAFEDTWHWNATAEQTYQELVTLAPERVSRLVGALRVMLGSSPIMAYLVMMTIRLIELHRVLKPTGSLYLHCDPTASHYLKLVLDAVFSPQNFANHLTWKRSDTHNDAKKQFSAIADHILLYRKSEKSAFHVLRTAHTDTHLANWFIHLQLPDGSTRRMTKQEIETSTVPEGARRFSISDLSSPNPRPNLMYEYKGYPHPAKGWRCNRERMEMLDAQGRLLFPAKQTGRIVLKKFLDEQEGVVVGDVWTDISQLRAADAERLGYPTQKPLALLERIIAASSNEGDIVLDPFCGCGTSIAAAQKMKRQWLGIDVTSLATAIIKSRMNAMYPGIQIKTVGEPADLQSAQQLAQDDRYQFQWWALSLITARPLGGQDGSKIGKKGSDRGIDGVLTFLEDPKAAPQRVIVQVKSGNVKSGDIRDLLGTVTTEKAAIGVFITLQEPTRDMRLAATTAGLFTSAAWGRSYPRLQILTIADLLGGRQVEMPAALPPYKQAQRVQADAAQPKMEF